MSNFSILSFFILMFPISNYGFNVQDRAIEKSIYSEALEDESIGECKLKLMGEFNGIGANIDTDKYYFTFDSTSKVYSLKVNLTHGDIFYIYHYEKSRALYYPIFNQKACDDFESIGLTRSPYSGSSYFWKVELTGEYEINVDYHIETIGNVWDIWGDEYSSRINYSFNNDSECYFATEFDKKNKYYLMTKNSEKQIFQYGKNYGKVFQSTSNISIYQKENVGIIQLEYDSKYAKEVELFVFDENNNLLSQFTYPLNDGFCYFHLNSLEGDYEFGKAAAVLYRIDNGIGQFVSDNVEYKNCILSLSQTKAKEIIEKYDSLSDKNKEIVDNSSISFIDATFTLKEKCLIKDIIGDIREISKVSFVFPVLAIVIPLGVIFLGGIGTFFFLYFKKRDS